MIRIPRNDAAGETHTLKIESTREGFEELLPQTLLMFIYADGNRDWVRLAIPVGLLPHIDNMECPCCRQRALPAPHGGTLLDVRLDDVSWFVRELVT